MLEENGAGIPLLRQVVGFIYLTWVPGIILLRVLRVHKVGAIETLLFSVGLSVSTVLFLGFAINTIYPMLDLLKPISEGPLLITMTVFVFAGAVIAYIVDRDFNQPEYITTEETFGWPVFLFALLPFLAIFGAWLVNNYRINTLLFVLLAVIAIVPALVAFRRIVPETVHYPFVIWTVGLSLLLHASLISNHIWGWDINQEFYISNLVIQNGAWDFSIYSNINAMLSIVMLAPIYSILCSIDIVWVFKIIYPLLFSLARPGIYMIARRQSYDRIAFYGTFFFITFFVFFTEMLPGRAAGDRRALPRPDRAPDHQQGPGQDQEVHPPDRLLVLAGDLALRRLVPVHGHDHVSRGSSSVVSELGSLNRNPRPLLAALRLGEARIRPELQAAPRGGAGRLRSITSCSSHLRAGLVHVHLHLLGPELHHRSRSSSSRTTSCSGFMDPETDQGSEIIVSGSTTPLHQLGKDFSSSPSSSSSSGSSRFSSSRRRWTSVARTSRSTARTSRSRSSTVGPRGRRRAPAVLLEAR